MWRFCFGVLWSLPHLFTAHPTATPRHPAIQAEVMGSNVVVSHTVLVVHRIGKSDMQFIIVHVSTDHPVNAHFWRDIRALKSKTDKNVWSQLPPFRTVVAALSGAFGGAAASGASGGGGIRRVQRRRHQARQAVAPETSGSSYARLPAQTAGRARRAAHWKRDAAPRRQPEEHAALLSSCSERARREMLEMSHFLFESDW